MFTRYILRISKTKQSSSPFSILSNAFQICIKTKGRIEITNTLTNAFLTVIKNNPAELFPAICLASDTLPTHRSNWTAAKRISWVLAAPQYQRHTRKFGMQEAETERVL